MTSAESLEPPPSSVEPSSQAAGKDERTEVSLVPVQSLESSAELPAATFSSTSVSYISDLEPISPVRSAEVTCAENSSLTKRLESSAELPAATFPTSVSYLLNLEPISPVRSAEMTCAENSSLTKRLESSAELPAVTFPSTSVSYLLNLEPISPARSPEMMTCAEDSSLLKLMLSQATARKPVLNFRSVLSEPVLSPGRPSPFGQLTISSVIAQTRVSGGGLSTGRPSNTLYGQLPTTKSPLPQAARDSPSTSWAAAQLCTVLQSADSFPQLHAADIDNKEGVSRKSLELLASLFPTTTVSYNLEPISPTVSPKRTCAEESSFTESNASCSSNWTLVKEHDPTLPSKGSSSHVVDIDGRADISHGSLFVSVQSSQSSNVETAMATPSTLTSSVLSRAELATSTESGFAMDRLTELRAAPGHLNRDFNLDDLLTDLPAAPVKYTWQSSKSPAMTFPITSVNDPLELEPISPAESPTTTHGVADSDIQKLIVLQSRVLKPVLTFQAVLTEPILCTGRPSTSTYEQLGTSRLARARMDKPTLELDTNLARRHPNRFACLKVDEAGELPQQPLAGLELTEEEKAELKKLDGEPGSLNLEWVSVFVSRSSRQCIGIILQSLLEVISGAEALGILYVRYAL